MPVSGVYPRPRTAPHFLRRGCRCRGSGKTLAALCSRWLRPFREMRGSSRSDFPGSARGLSGASHRAGRHLADGTRSEKAKARASASARPSKTRSHDISMQRSSSTHCHHPSYHRRLSHTPHHPAGSCCSSISPGATVSAPCSLPPSPATAFNFALFHELHARQNMCVCQIKKQLGR